MAPVTGDMDLLLPGLFDLPSGLAESLVVMPTLARILRYARPLANNAHTLDANLANVLQIPLPPPESESESVFHGLPVAWAFDETSRADSLILFEPVHLRPDMQQAIVTPVGRQPADLADFRQLVADLGGEFVDDFECREVSDGVFLMSLRQLTAPDCYPHPLSVLGKPANPHIGRSQAQLAWHRLQTEIQMYLHQHAVNGERLARDEAPINSLWFWGAGKRPPEPGRRPTFYCSDPVLRQLGIRLGLQCPAPASLDDGSDDIAVVDLRLLAWLKNGEDMDLASLLANIDSELIRPLLARVERRRMTLRLRGASERDYWLGPWSLKCFWRRRYQDVEHHQAAGDGSA